MKRSITIGLIQASLATIICVGLAALAEVNLQVGFYLGIFLGNFFFGAYVQNQKRQKNDG